MSATPDAAEYFNHFLDSALGIACLLFLATALWAVGAEVWERRRRGAPLFGPWPPAPGTPGEDPAPLGGEEVMP